MKIEARGKYAGVKVHLDGDEAEWFLGALDVGDKILSTKPLPQVAAESLKFAVKLGRKIAKLVKDVPNLLKDRTEEQITAALTGDQEKIIAQLEALKKGKNWKKV